MSDQWACFGCGEVGHLVAQCPHPAADRHPPRSLADASADQAAADLAGAFAAHMAMIDRYVADWWQGKISTEEKRRLISAENHAFYGPSVRKALTYP